MNECLERVIMPVAGMILPFMGISVRLEVRCSPVHGQAVESEEFSGGTLTCSIGSAGEALLLEGTGEVIEW